MRIVYMGAHSVLEHDDVRLFHELGHEVFSIGAYIHPSRPMDPIRPALPQVPEVPECIAAVDALGQQGHEDTLMAAKDMGLPDAVLDWAEVIVCSAYEHRWLAPLWDRYKGKRVIWRTIGQSAHPNEWMMRPFRAKGLEIVRYSPKERNIPEYAGEDALIRFYKDPDEWNGWTGEDPVVTNVTQSLFQRSLADDGNLQPEGYQWTSFSFWDEVTRGLPRLPSGKNSEVIGGTGTIDTDAMKDLLRKCRAYLYTGTQPASYTLGLIEAMMTGIPAVSITADWYRILLYGSLMFEGYELTQLGGNSETAHNHLVALLNDYDYAKEVSAKQQAFAIETFGIDTIKAQWAAHLDGGLRSRTASGQLQVPSVPGPATASVAA